MSTLTERINTISILFAKEKAGAIFNPCLVKYRVKL
jgi:hypothetical protein